MLSETTSSKAELFFDLHEKAKNNKQLLILPNVWDALTAKLFEKSGVKAIATTSAGIAATFGYADGKLPKSLLLTMVDRIIKSVNIPVSVDLEAGYGQSPQEVCETVGEILKIGAVGINIEDAIPERPGYLYTIDEQVAKIKAIKELAKEKNVRLFVNARTDIFWLQLFSPKKRLHETLARLKAYQDAGADGLFVPGLTEIPLITEVTKNITAPLNLLAGPWLENTPISTLELLGVSRLSIGSAAVRDFAAHLQKLSNELAHKRNCLCFNTTISYSNFNQFFSKKC